MKIFFALLFFTTALFAGDLRLASLFQDNMVVQRDKPIIIWGEAKAGEQVTVELTSQKVSMTADTEGKWMIKLPQIKLKGAFEISVKSGNESAKIKNAVLGEVWICSGQSNMQMGYGGIPEIKKMAAAAKNIRTFKVNNTVSFTEQNYCEGNWQVAAPPSAVACAFAYNLQQEIDCPVGIILTCWGSSSVEGWMPMDMAEKLPHFKKELEACRANDKARVAEILAKKKMSGKDNIFLRTRPNLLYNAMMHPLIPFSLSGIVWYQGEANTKSVEAMLQYGQTLPMWIQRYRKEWGNDQLQLMGVMLPGFGRNFSKGKTLDSPDAITWAWMRESQMKILDLDHTSIATTIDLGDAKNIHPKDKAPIGQRLALLARRDVLKEAIVAEGPVFLSQKIKGPSIELSFENSKGLKTVDGETPKAFWICDKSKKWLLAKAEIKGDKIILNHSDLKKPLYVRYAFAAMPKVNFTNVSAVPARPFRTDSFTP
ncbi:sialate O-acetylesterase [Lentisphaera profundi]|uniref:Sialate O-acetylesterase n=1 Tax=Lentisphaera profundi TaxID=1658616 RepID=A0ABY7VY90_9BACT|nr:sialate O-acetylesterase [Lentisphaera profundi]WDE99213.1 sialate O-acetylesterase [Lentisphaera profundi]